MSNDEGIKVFVRVRPPNEREKQVFVFRFHSKIHFTDFDSGKSNLRWSRHRKKCSHSSFKMWWKATTVRLWQGSWDIQSILDCFEVLLCSEWLGRWSLWKSKWCVWDSRKTNVRMRSWRLQLNYIRVWSNRSRENFHDAGTENCSSTSNLFNLL